MGFRIGRTIYFDKEYSVAENTDAKIHLIERSNK